MLAARRPESAVAGLVAHYQAVVVLPAGLTGELHRQLKKTKAVHSEDLREGYGRILIPYAMWQGNPNRARAWEWQYVFPAPRRTREPRKGTIRRHHMSKSTVNRRLGEAVALAGIDKSPAVPA